MSRPPSDAQRRQFLAGIRITSFGILVSRVLGMLRDVATAGLLGMSGSGVMDAFVVAFRLPNLFRRLFGEGALAASYLPAFAAEWERDPRRGWQLASVVLTLLSGVLGAIVIAGELVCGLLWASGPRAPGALLVIQLSAWMLPYLLWICLAAQLAATLHALGHFAVPALAPALLNVCWLIAAWVVAPWFGPEKAVHAQVLAAAVLVAGVLQVAVQLPVLRRLGARFDFDYAASREALCRVIVATAPMVLGLAVTQINTFLDSLLAWSLTLKDPAQPIISWLPGAIHYPLPPGAAASIYYGERLYQFPQGILGLAIATAIFPLLSRHAARGDLARLGADLTLGLRLTIFAAVPAGVGLMLLADPLVRLLFEHGRFTPDDALRTARVIAVYGLGVWAYCAGPIVVRSYYAVGDRQTPVRVAAVCVALDLALNLVLLWPLGEVGIALSTAVVASLQVVVLSGLLVRRVGPIGWRRLADTTLRSLVSTTVMAAAGWLVLARPGAGDSFAARLEAVAVPLVVCLAVYAASAALLRQAELGWLVGRHVDSEA